MLAPSLRLDAMHEPPRPRCRCVSTLGRASSSWTRPLRVACEITVNREAEPELRTSGSVLFDERAAGQERSIRGDRFVSRRHGHPGTRLEAEDVCHDTAMVEDLREVGLEADVRR